MKQRQKAKPRKIAHEKRKPLTRSEVMRAVKSKNTKPELLVRAFLRKEKIKFRTYGNLPGHPDIILKEHQTVIRVMGCFWHGHSCKSGNRIPKSNVDYWIAKLKRNVERDKENKRDLKRLGWRIIDVWACSLRNPNWKARLKHKLRKLRL
jgi:DNA mismatch endonuclease (patch repair protein)